MQVLRNVKAFKQSGRLPIEVKTKKKEEVGREDQTKLCAGSGIKASCGICMLSKGREAEGQE